MVAVEVIDVNQIMLRELTTMRPGAVAKTDLLDLMAPYVREVDPETFEYKPQALSSIASAPVNGYRLIDNRSLMRQGLPDVHQLIREIPAPYRDVFRYLETEYGLIVPVGMEDLGLFMISEYRAVPAAFGSADVQIYSLGTTTAWTKPTASALRWTSILLIGAGGPGGGGARVTTSGNDAAGGGGGGGGGCISRLVTLASLSNGNVVVGSGVSGATAQGLADTNGNTPGSNGNNSTFAGLTAGGGAKGTGGGQGAGAQTGAGGAGGTGDIAGTSGGTGRSGATVGDNGGDQTSGPAGAGGGGGGGATADSDQADGGRGGHGFIGGGLRGTAGGGAAGTTASRIGNSPAFNTGGGSGGGAGSNASNTAGGVGGTGGANMGFGAGFGGGGGRARNAATTTGSGGGSSASPVGYAHIISF